MRKDVSRTARRPLPHVDASDALSANKRHNERGNETVTPHRCRSVQRTRLGCACTPRSADETDGFGQRCAGGRNARRHCLPGRPGGARTHPRRNTPSRARRERRERAAERVILALRESFLRCAAARGRRADERESTTVRLAASRREVEREHALTTRERIHTHAKKHTVRPSAKGGQPALPRHRERV